MKNFETFFYFLESIILIRSQYAIHFVTKYFHEIRIVKQVLTILLT